MSLSSTNTGTGTATSSATATASSTWSTLASASPTGTPWPCHWVTANASLFVNVTVGIAVNGISAAALTADAGVIGSLRIALTAYAGLASVGAAAVLAVASIDGLSPPVNNSAHAVTVMLSLSLPPGLSAARSRSAEILRRALVANAAPQSTFAAFLAYRGTQALGISADSIFVPAAAVWCAPAPVLELAAAAPPGIGVAAIVSISVLLGLLVMGGCCAALVLLGCATGRWGKKAKTTAPAASPDKYAAPPAASGGGAPVGDGSEENDSGGGGRGAAAVAVAVAAEQGDAEPAVASDSLADAPPTHDSPFRSLPIPPRRSSARRNSDDAFFRNVLTGVVVLGGGAEGSGADAEEAVAASTRPDLVDETVPVLSARSRAQRHSVRSEISEPGLARLAAADSLAVPPPATTADASMSETRGRISGAGDDEHEQPALPAPVALGLSVESARLEIPHAIDSAHTPHDSVCEQGPTPPDVGIGADNSACAAAGECNALEQGADLGIADACDAGSAPEPLVFGRVSTASPGPAAAAERGSELADERLANNSSAAPSGSGAPTALDAGPVREPDASGPRHEESAHGTSLATGTPADATGGGGISHAHTWLQPPTASDSRHVDTVPCVGEEVGSSIPWEIGAMAVPSSALTDGLNSGGDGPIVTASPSIEHLDDRHHSGVTEGVTAATVTAADVRRTSVNAAVPLPLLTSPEPLSLLQENTLVADVEQGGEAAGSASANHLPEAAVSSADHEAAPSIAEKADIDEPLDSSRSVADRIAGLAADASRDGAQGIDLQLSRWPLQVDFVRHEGSILMPLLPSVASQPIFASASYLPLTERPAVSAPSAPGAVYRAVRSVPRLNAQALVRPFQPVQVALATVPQQLLPPPAVAPGVVVAALPAAHSPAAAASPLLHTTRTAAAPLQVQSPPVAEREVALKRVATAMARGMSFRSVSPLPPEEMPSSSQPVRVAVQVERPETSSPRARGSPPGPIDFGAQETNLMVAASRRATPFDWGVADTLAGGHDYVDVPSLPSARAAGPCAVPVTAGAEPPGYVAPVDGPMSSRDLIDRPVSHIVHDADAEMNGPGDAGPQPAGDVNAQADGYDADGEDAAGGALPLQPLRASDAVIVTDMRADADAGCIEGVLVAETPRSWHSNTDANSSPPTAAEVEPAVETGATSLSLGSAIGELAQTTFAAVSDGTVGNVRVSGVDARDVTAATGMLAEPLVGTVPILASNLGQPSAFESAESSAQTEPPMLHAGLLVRRRSSVTGPSVPPPVIPTTPAHAVEPELPWSGADSGLHDAPVRRQSSVACPSVAASVILDAPSQTACAIVCPQTAADLRQHEPPVSNSKTSARRRSSAAGLLVPGTFDVVARSSSALSPPLGQPQRSLFAARLATAPVPPGSASRPSRALMLQTRTPFRVGPAEPVPLGITRVPDGSLRKPTVFGLVMPASAAQLGDVSPTDRVFDDAVAAALDRAPDSSEAGAEIVTAAPSVSNRESETTSLLERLQHIEAGSGGDDAHTQVFRRPGALASVASWRAVLPIPTLASVNHVSRPSSLSSATPPVSSRPSPRPDESRIVDSPHSHGNGRIVPDLLPLRKTHSFATLKASPPVKREFAPPGSADARDATNASLDEGVPSDTVAAFSSLFGGSTPTQEPFLPAMPTPRPAAGSSSARGPPLSQPPHQVENGSDETLERSVAPSAVRAGTAQSWLTRGSRVPISSSDRLPSSRQATPLSPLLSAHLRWLGRPAGSPVVYLPELPAVPVPAGRFSRTATPIGRSRGPRDHTAAADAAASGPARPVVSPSTDGQHDEEAAASIGVAADHAAGLSPGRRLGWASAAAPAIPALRPVMSALPSAWGTPAVSSLPTAYCSHTMAAAAVSASPSPQGRASTAVAGAERRRSPSPPPAVPSPERHLSSGNGVRDWVRLQTNQN